MPTMTNTCRHMLFTLILALYLLLPAQNVLHAAVFIPDNFIAQSDTATAANPACPACPCSDEKDSGCCDTTFCNCSFHAPPPAFLHQNYAPMVTITCLTDPYRALPRVYGSIFVPPQNLS